MDELDQIIDKAINAGLSDTDIQFIVAEWRAKQAPLSPKATGGMFPQSTPENEPIDPRYGDLPLPYAQELTNAKRAGDARWQETKEHPVRRAAEIGVSAAIPGAVGLGYKYAGPAMGAMGKALENPVVGGISTAAYDIYQGKRNPVQIAKDALIGAASGTVLGKVMSKFGAASTPSATPPAATTPRANIDPRGVSSATTTGVPQSVPTPQDPVPFMVSVPKQTATAAPRTGTAFVPGEMPKPTPRPAASTGARAVKMAETDSALDALDSIQELTGGAGARAVKGKGTMPATTPGYMPPSSKSKTATRMSDNDRAVFAREVRAGKNEADAMQVVLRERAERHAVKYGNAKMDAEARRAMERDAK